MSIPLPESLKQFYSTMSHGNSKSPRWLKIDSHQLIQKYKGEKAKYYYLIPDRVDLSSFISKNPDWFTLHCYESAPQDKDVITVTIKEKVYYVETIVCILPFAKRVVEESQYMMLDGSFEAVKPYVYCLINFVKYNHSYPVGFVIHPTESMKLYKRGLKDLARRLGTTANFLINETPVITDMHQSFISLFQNNKHFYFCHVHILRLMGQNSLVAIFVKLLFSFSKSEELFNKEAPCIKQVIMDIASKYEENQNPFGKWYERLLKMASGSDDGDFKFSRWALYKRINDGVAKTTNLSESLHSAINRELRRGQRPRLFNDRISYGINTIYDTIKIHLKNIEKKAEYKRQIRQKLIKYSNTLICPNLESIDCPYHCQKYNEMIYGVAFGCPHKGITTYDIKEITELAYDKRITQILWINQNAHQTNLIKVHTDVSKQEKPEKIPDQFKEKFARSYTSKFFDKYGHNISEKARVFLHAIKSVSITENVNPEKFFFKLMGETNFEGDFQTDNDKHDFFMRIFELGQMIADQHHGLQPAIFNVEPGVFPLNIEENQISDEPVIY